MNNMDEYLYWLWPYELKTHIPRIEKLMLEGMSKIITSVRIGVETTCMNFWDKKAQEFSTIQWSPDGLPILEDPPFVKELLTKKGA